MICSPSPFFSAAAFCLRCGEEVQLFAPHVHHFECADFVLPVLIAHRPSSFYTKLTRPRSCPYPRRTGDIQNPPAPRSRAYRGRCRPPGMVCFVVSTSVITALTIRSESSFNEPHPDRDSKRVNKHRAISIPLTFLSSKVLSSCFCAVGLIQFMKKALLPLLASGGTTHRPRTYSLQGSAVPPDRRRPRNGLHGV